MSSATVQAKIAAFESLSSSSSSAVFLPAKLSQDASESLLETPISPTTASVLPPVVHFAPANVSRQPSKPSPSPSPPNLGRKTSLIDLRDWVVEDGSTQNGRLNGHAANNGATRSPRQFAAPLINLESPPSVKPKPKHLVSKPLADASGLHGHNSLRSVASSSSLHSSSASYLYPPGRTGSLTVDRGHTYPPKPESSRRSGHAPASSISSFHSVSLSSDTDPSTSTSSQHIASFPVEQEPDRDLSVKSYGSDSVSLDESYEEVPSTFVGSPATERLINLDWERATAHRKVQPPRLPQRPSSSSTGTTIKKPVPRPPPPKVLARSTPTSPIVRPTLSASSSASTLANSYVVSSIAPRRVPPPPSHSSDRSSILSTATSDSGFSVKYATYQSNHNKAILPISAVQLASIQRVRRPTPIPPKARKRYEDLFNANVIQRRKAEKWRKDMPPPLTPHEARRSRRAVGWRGLSIDLTTAGGAHLVESKAKEMQEVSEELVDEVIDNDETLEGRIIRCIWIRSGLDRKRLREIWNECDLLKIGALNRESFVRGMWRIDEELRRAQTDTLKHPASTNSYSSRSRGGLGVARRQTKAILT